MLRNRHRCPIFFGHLVDPGEALHTCETLPVIYSGAGVVE
jgi:hypothetical protein